MKIILSKKWIFKDNEAFDGSFQLDIFNVGEKFFIEVSRNENEYCPRQLELFECNWEPNLVKLESLGRLAELTTRPLALGVYNKEDVILDTCVTRVGWFEDASWEPDYIKEFNRKAQNRRTLVNYSLMFLGVLLFVWWLGVFWSLFVLAAGFGSLMWFGGWLKSRKVEVEAEGEVT